MPSLTFYWQKIDNSYFLLVQEKRWQLPEWSMQGEVHLRQVYQHECARFCAIVSEPERGQTILGKFARLGEAQQAVEAHFQARTTHLAA